MNEEVKLSIIIPAYNVEKYIVRCVESVLNLEIEAYEIIIVDDGSTDTTWKKIEELKSRKKNIVIVYKENGGPQSARSEGLRIAKGEYIAYLDSDDWVDQGYFEQFIKKLDSDSDIDVCVGAIVRSYFDGSESDYYAINQREQKHRNEAALSQMMLGKQFKWEISGKVYRRTLFERFLPKENIKVCDDLDWNWELFKGVKAIWYSPYKKYHYYMNAESITQNRGREMLTQHIVYKRILEDEALTDSEIRSFFLKAYCKMMPRIILEICTGDTDEDDGIRECQKEFLWAYRELRDRSFLDEALEKAMLGSLLECKRFFFGYVAEINKVISSIKEKNIYIYGTGFVAEYLYRWKERYPIEICGYVVSNGQPNPKKYKGKQVLYLSEINEDIENTAFVLAMVRKAQTAVLPLLQKRNFHNIYSINTAPFCDG